MRPLLLVLGVGVLTSLTIARAEGPELVANGSFEAADPGRPEAPAAWRTAGNAAVAQRLDRVPGRDGGHAARLACSAFGGDGPDSHAMLAQVGHVAVTRGRWYRLSLWARAEALRAGSVEVALMDTDGWANGGLADAFTPTGEWSRFDLIFRAKADVPAATSRLQIWFKSTGTLWLDDVTLTETSEGAQYFPRIESDGVANAVPNSSFECGAAGWGGYTYGVSGWAGNLFRLEGTVDAADARHGRHSLAIALDAARAPVRWFDYYEPVRDPVRRVLAANHGWIRVRPGEPLTLSAELKADAPGTAAVLAAIEAPDRLRRREVRVGTSWVRHSFTFTPQVPSLFIAVGLDLEATGRDRATLRVDAVQLERGGQATPYRPRATVESFLEIGPGGPVFDASPAGVPVAIRAYNDADEPRPLSGQVAVRDAMRDPEAPVPVEAELPPRADAILALPPLAAGRLGVFRAAWEPADGTEGVEVLPARFAVIEPAPTGTDSLFGFNHAFPWDFLVELSHRAGVRWWRDWSAKWDTIEPERGRLRWDVPDAQIGRVLGLGGNVEVLLPFPSARWSTEAREEEIRRAAPEPGYLRDRLAVAYAARDPDDFSRYAAAVADRYRDAKPRGVSHVQVLNEPVYTNYALPRQFGYTTADYIRHVEVAARAIKAVDGGIQIVGGPSANLAAATTREFITAGGLRHLDVFDLHLYDAPRPAEAYEEPFAALEALMREHGGPKPFWITEWGCYADDDPPVLPLAVGDPTMNRCRWPSERAAAEHIVKFAAVAAAHGARKLFFHAGTAGTINGPDAGNVLFEYGGAPRVMYGAVAAAEQRLGVPERCERIIDRDGLHAYLFRARGEAVAVAWGADGRSPALTVAGDCRAFDLMGNPLPGGPLRLGAAPVYLTGPGAAAVLDAAAP